MHPGSLWSIALAFLLAVGSLLGYEHYRQGQSLAELENERLLHNAAVLEAGVGRRLRSISGSMGIVAADLPNLLEPTAGPKHPKLNYRLRVLVDALTGVRALLAVNKAGLVYGASRPDLLGMDFKGSARYRAISQNPDPQTLYLSEPFVTPFGTYTFSIGRTVLDNGGAFDGYLLAVMDPDYFQEILGSARYAPDVQVSMAHSEGRLVARLGDPVAPPQDLPTEVRAALIQHLQSGQVASANHRVREGDATQRLLAARTLDADALHMDAALVFLISRDWDALYAPWRSHGMTKLALFVGISALTLLGLALYNARHAAFTRLQAARVQERQQGAAQLSETSGLLTLAEQAAHAGAWKWDVRSNTMQWTDALFRLFGLDPRTATASLETWQQVLHPLDLEMAGAKVSESVEQKQPLVSSYRIVRPSGEVRWIDAFGTPAYDEQGQPTVFAGICVDATQRMQAKALLQDSEARFRDLFEHLPIAYQALDSAGHWLDANQQLADLLGFATPQELLGQDFFSFWDAGQPSQGHSARATFLRSQQLEGEIPLRRRDGSLITAMVTGRIQRDAQDRFVRTHCIVIDISARRAMEDEIRQLNTDLERKVAERTAELQEHRDHLELLVHARTRDLAAAKDEAEHASKAKSVLLANMSHELRTPLNHIIGFNRIVQQEITSPQGKERMDKVLSAANRLLRLINNLLDTAMLESQQLQLSGRDFHVQELLDEVALQATERLAAKGMQLHCALLGDTQARLHGDFKHLLQVVDEVVDNAIKFSSTGPVVLRATQQRTNPGLCTLRLEVQDQGVGIPADQQAQMFQLFVQQDGSSTRQYGGTGLGLALCQRIVNLMAGTIGLESSPGKGTRVWIDIALAVAQQAAPALPAARWDVAHKPLEELLWLLVSGDMEAHPLWQELEPLYAHLLGAAAPHIGQAIEGFDFATAAQLLSAQLPPQASPQST